MKNEHAGFPGLISNFNLGKLWEPNSWETYTKHQDKCYRAQINITMHEEVGEFEVQYCELKRLIIFSKIMLYSAP